MSITVRLDRDSAALELSGTGPAPTAASLNGTRAQVAGTIEKHTESWTARVPLRASRWGRAALPLPRGTYTLELDGIAIPDSLSLAPALTDELALELSGQTVQIGPPISVADASAAGQRAREEWYVRAEIPPENAVFFESFYGRNASCNPRAIDREVARVAPAVRRYWSVVDLSVEVPEGAIAVVEGSAQWWRARGAARLIVINDWMRRRFHRRPGQVVLQTWHGTPLKRLALHRRGFDPRRALAVLREGRRWDVVLAQNRYAAGILRRAYAFLRRPIWVEGYPRDDVLITGDGAPIRRALGLRSDERVVLYAPTWRDDREEMVDFLDLAALARDTDATVLVRGHSRTLLPGRDARAERVIDVTGYPDVSELLVVADVLITDYSSVMFDFSATGKPMVFFTPDLEHYRGELRGFYFDLAAHAPGPLVSTQADLVAAVREPRHDPERYERWRARFNPRDDGHAAERVVARILDQGFVDRAGTQVAGHASGD